MNKLIYGVGYNSKGSYKAFESRRKTKAYRTWYDMITRCYDDNRNEKSLTYSDCTVSEHWHNFQDFAQWFYNHKYSDKGYDLDKDILSLDNKTYSPDKCCFVPRDLNLLLTDRRNDRGLQPQGVTWNKASSSYISRINADGKRKYLGMFNCPQEAYQVYKKAKEAHVKEKALEWQDRIAPNVFEALMAWRLTE